MSISAILNIAKNALLASQVSIQVTSHNISNVNTDGYSRQEVIFDEQPAVRIGNALIGNGVFASGVMRHYDRYLEKELSKKNTELYENKVYAEYFQRIEAILNEDNTKLTSSITEFFNNWQELSLDPQSLAIREGIKSSAQNLCRIIRDMYNGLTQLQIELNSKVKNEVDNINRITAAIVDLNKKIFEGSSQTSESNDYLDKRQTLINELAAKMNITYFEDKYGMVTILTKDGKLLVDGGNGWELDLLNDSDTGFYRIGWKNSSDNLTDITDSITSGSLRGFMAMRDEEIVRFIDDLDTLAQVLIEEVNTIHKDGYTLNHVQQVPDEPDNILFFKELTGYYAKDIDISDEIKSDIKNIAASEEVNDLTGKPVGNGVALKISGLMDEGLFYDGTATFVNYTSSITNKIGQLTKGALSVAQYSEDTMVVMEKQRESVSGVSLDEEMANLIKFQYAYQAAARLFVVADDLFKSLLEAVR